MDIRYCWIADCLKSENIDIEYCLTLKLLADFFTKPLQGSLFQKFRDYVLGYKNLEQLQRDLEESVGQERVKKNGELEICPTNIPSKSGDKRKAMWADVTRGLANK